MSLGTLYGDGPLCPFTHRVLIASRELDAHVDVRYGDDIPATVREANTSGSWPVFVPAGGGGMLQDSSEIVEHLIARSGAKGEAYRSERDTLSKLDMLTIDGSGGGTGMSPWRMMCEWGVPTFYLQAMTHEAMMDLRMLIFELHPPILKEEGLAAALRARLATVEARAGLQTEFQVEGEEDAQELRSSFAGCG